MAPGPQKAPSFTFAGGVLGPGLYGRVDLNKYQTGVKHAHNCVVAVEGGLFKRFGTYLVGKVKFQDRPTKLIPWRIANDDSYHLEFGDNYIRFIRFGGYVSIPTGHVPAGGSTAVNVDDHMEITTPFSASEVREIKFTYANDIMYLFHKDHQPMELKRIGLYDWALVTMNFTPHPVGPTGLTVNWQIGSVSGSVWAWANNSSWAVVDVNYQPKGQDYSYCVSATLADGTETLPSAVVTVQADLGNPSYRMHLSWTAVAGAVQYTVYKGKNGVFGFIGYVAAPGVSYNDTNFAPSYDTVPIGSAYTFPAGEWPRVGEFYKQRMTYGSTKTKPQSLWLSRPLLFNSLYKSVPSQDDDAILALLVGRERHTINHMLQLKKFIIFTDTAEWVLKSLGDGGMTPATIDPEPETAYGSDPFLRPLAIGDRILFVQNITGDIRDLGYEYTSDAYRADDLSRLSRHLFGSRKITSWTYGAFPQNLLHTATDDGLLRTMTYVREHEIWGWTTTDTKGEYLDVSAVSEIGHDGVYFQIRREIDGVPTTFVERTEVNFSQRIEDMVYVDCALSYRDERQFSNLVRVSETEATFDLDSVDDLTVGMELALEFVETTAERKESLNSAYRIEITDIVGSSISGTVLRNAEFPEEFPDLLGSCFVCKASISGLDHLGAEPIWVLADGKVLKNMVLTAGTLLLPFNAARVHVGLPYTAEIETLDLDSSGNEGMYSYKAVDEVVIRLMNSRGVWAGSAQSPRELELIPSRDNENYYEPNEPLDGAYRVPAHVAWEMTAAVRVESRDPLPLNVLNIVPQLIYGN